jgi:hypothetical protein
LPAEVLNLGGKQLRFKKTPKIERWCEIESAKADQRAYRRKSRQYRFWTKYHERLLARLVRKKNPPRSDLVAFGTWKKLSVQNRLSIDELSKSFKRGEVTHISRSAGDSGGGVTTWGGILVQFNIIRARIGENWRDWLPENKAQIRDLLHPIAEFHNQLAKRNDLA